MGCSPQTIDNCWSDWKTGKNLQKLIDSFSDSLPNDLPMNDGQPDKDRIKSTIARLKTKIKNHAKRNIVDWTLCSSKSKIVLLS